MEFRLYLANRLACRSRVCLRGQPRRIAGHMPSTERLGFRFNRSHSDKPAFMVWGCLENHATLDGQFSKIWALVGLLL